MSANVCPFIATGADSSKRSSQPSAAHSCFAKRPAGPIDLQRQGEICLTPTFTACPIFLAWASREAAQTIDAPAPQPLPFGTPAASAPVDLAAADLEIDLSGSWMIGDKPIDVKCGRNAGSRTVLVKTGYGSKQSNTNADFVMKDVTEALKHIIALGE